MGMSSAITVLIATNDCISGAVKSFWNQLDVAMFSHTPFCSKPCYLQKTLILFILINI